jgi:glycosyltransferase involved in cell wall biosynthesis
LKTPATEPALWYLISSSGIGGAERRIVKVATYFAGQGLFPRVNLVVNKALSDAYAKDRELDEMLRASPIRMVVKEGWLEQLLLPDDRKNRWLKRLHRYLVKMPSLYAAVLKRMSWYRYLKSRVSSEDIMHCFFGDPARNAGLLMATDKGQNVILELTSNRLVERVARQMQVSLGKKRVTGKRLYIRSVTQVIYDNFTRMVPASFFTDRGVDLAPYCGPFIAMDSPCERRAKEKVIVFAHRFIEPKNPMLFCRIIRKLLDDGQLDGWKIKLRGRGALENDMRAQLAPYVENGTVDIGFSYELGKELAHAMVSVSIIVTGNEPSNSVYEAMRNGNLLLLSRTGNTVKQFDHPDVVFVGLSERSLTDGLKRIVAICESSDFSKKSENMRQFFDHIREHSGYATDVMDIYQDNR